MTAVDKQMAADAAEAMKFTRRHFVVELDYSPASVQRLEEAAKDVPFAIDGGASAENVDLLARIWGAYVGEVLRRGGNGLWQRIEGAEPCILSGGVKHHPHQAVRKRLTKPSSDGCLAAFFQQCCQPS